MRLMAAGVVGVAGAQGAKRPMTFADLQAMKRVSDPQVSPSGKWVLFSVTDVSLEKNSKVNQIALAIAVRPVAHRRSHTHTSSACECEEGLQISPLRPHSARTSVEMTVPGRC